MDEKARPERSKVLKIIGIATFLLVAGASWLAISTAGYMKGILRDQFNEQQLVLARHAAQRVEGHINGAIDDLLLLNSLPAVQYGDPESYEALLLSTLPVFNGSSIIAIRRIDRQGNPIFAVSEHGIVMHSMSPAQKEPEAYLSWASDPANRGKTMGTSIYSKEGAKDRGALVCDLISPTYEDASDTAHPLPSRAFSGYVRLTLDVTHLMNGIMPSIRSGKTGYAWVIDSNGKFIYHPDKSFIGETAFDARSQRGPGLSFAEINLIQRDEMTKGKEGTGSYFTGWHREIVKPMEKLLAFSPVSIQGPYVNYAWSVAVTAPAQEVESLIYAVYTRQFILQALVVFIICLGSLFVVLYERRWSSVLEHEVAVKTEHVRKYAYELESSETKYRSLVESAEDLIFTIDRKGLIRTANQHMSRVFEANLQEMTGQSLYRFLPREQVYEQLNYVWEVLDSGKGRKIETHLTLPAGNLWFDIQYIPLNGGGGQADYALAIARDITDRKDIEQQLINTEKLASLGTMAAGVAHEINNPIGIMLGFVDLLLEKMDPGSMAYNDLKTVERHGLHCKSIVERLLSFARIREEHEERCDLNANIESIVSVVKHTLDMNNIELILSLCPDLPPVKGDSTGLQQVFLNLINNAVQAMDGKGALRIETRPGSSGREVEASVMDTGSGIKTEYLGKIFDPFFTTKKVGEGTGLGLSVSYGIITRFGGRIECRSLSEEEAPGASGTTFKVVLPASHEVMHHLPA
ncbi:MAG: ATP-binding protein [Syntrophobacteraceae bacterium]